MGRFFSVADIRLAWLIGIGCGLLATGTACSGGTPTGDSVAGSQEHIARTRTAEATAHVKALYDGARRYYLDTPQPGITPVPPQFPQPSMAPQPPLGTCCAQGGMCPPDAGWWTSPVWTALRFSLRDRHHYSYEYITDGTTEFTVRAIGDLDCDGVYSTFEMTGAIDPSEPDRPTGSPTMRRVRELE